MDGPLHFGDSRVSELGYTFGQVSSGNGRDDIEIHDTRFDESIIVVDLNFGIQPSDVTGDWSDGDSVSETVAAVPGQQEHHMGLICTRRGWWPTGPPDLATIHSSPSA